MAEIGPVQLMSIGFEPEANFEGRIVDELAKLEKERTIRILDLLFIAKDTDSDEIVVLEHHGTESTGEIVAALLGMQLDDEAGQGAPAAEEHSFGFTKAEIAEMAAGLEPGGSAGLLLIEHVWAGELEAAIAATGGTIVQHGMLDPEQARALVG